VIKEWCDDCTDNHPECKDPRSQIILPTRLIEVFTQEDPMQQHPRLVDTQDLDFSTTEYTTLSHSWGLPSKMPIRTLLSNVDSFKQEIPLENIPKTFRDAMDMTQKLGIRYISIDSLCIIQDSASDWQTEASKMCDVYEGGYLNITAIDSPDAQGGCSLEPGASTVEFETPEGTAVSISIPFHKLYTSSELTVSITQPSKERRIQTLNSSIYKPLWLIARAFAMEKINSTTKMVQIRGLKSLATHCLCSKSTASPQQS
jgi:hypothetical protein